MAANANGKGRRAAPLLMLAAMVAGPLATSATAEAPRFSQPVDCTLGSDCYIQQYVDRDTGPNQRDAGCGRLANDGHKGTDFALPTLAQMQTGVAVLAAAPGIVRGIRDGMPDIDATAPGAPDVSGRECGNGVAIDHGEGWETQYCHMLNGSVRVRQGQQVDTGDILGLVGMSGEATFPHMHFSVRQGNAVIDPFNPDMTEPCGLGGASLWKVRPPYVPGGLVAAGVLDRVPEYDEVKAGLPEIALPSGAGAIVLWGYAFAGDVDDILEITISGPTGTLLQHRDRLEKRQPFFFRAAGKKAPDDGFPEGRYTGSVRHLRGTAVLGQREVAFDLD